MQYQVVGTDDTTTVTAVCKDACKDIFDVRTTQLVTNFCVATAVAPLSSDKSIEGQIPWESKQSLQRESHCVISGDEFSIPSVGLGFVSFCPQLSLVLGYQLLDLWLHAL